MTRLFAAIFTVASLIGGMSSASACCLWPFGGWWGAGYNGYYGANYSPYVPVSAGYAGYQSAGYYSAGYGAADCCAPACCDPCGCGSGGCGSGGCGPGGCNTGSCVGTPTPTPAGGLKPETDTNFDRGTREKGTYDDDGFDRDRLRTRDPLPEPDADPLPGARSAPLRSRTRPAPIEPDPVDDFRSAPAGGADSEPFGADQIQKKPPMDEPGGDLPAVNPAVDPATPDSGTTDTLNGSTFLEDEKAVPADQTRRDQPVSLTKRTSGLNEVIAPKRLASRSLPAPAVREKTSFAGKGNSDKAGPRPTVRWISIPLPEGNAQL